jgi:hypothetical protein
MLTGYIGKRKQDEIEEIMNIDFPKRKSIVIDIILILCISYQL